MPNNPAEWLGWVKAVADQWGITNYVYVVLIVGLAFGVYKRFFDKGE
jgi:hypothetical protein